MFSLNGVSRCHKWAGHFNLTIDMMFVGLYKCLNCATDKTIDVGHTADTECDYLLKNTINDAILCFLVQAFKDRLI